MRSPARPFRISIGAAGWAAPREFSNGPWGHLSLRDDALWSSSNGAAEPSQLERDLVRLGFAVYAADRLVRRSSARSFYTPVRQIELRVEVGEPDFWRQNAGLARQALGVLCDDCWDIQFVRGPSISHQLALWPQVVPTVLQYSGGLDSAAGAVIRAAETAGPITFVTAVHQTHQGKRVRGHMERIRDRLGRPVDLATARTAFGPSMREFVPRFDYQEPSQRCRGFLFLACGGAVAVARGASRVEVLENGVGAINLPLMAGMTFGSRSTRGCHPRFLRAMSKLVTRVAGRPVDFVLPFAAFTKSEMVRRAALYGLNDVLADSVSCVHPLRVRGRASQCGLCPACIGRRQAFLSAGLPLDTGQYLDDPFDPTRMLPRVKLEYLTAIVAQVVELLGLADDGSCPETVRRHFGSTGLLRFGEAPAIWTAALRQYRDEWLRLIHAQHAAGQRWSGLLPERLIAA